MNTNNLLQQEVATRKAKTRAMISKAIKSLV